MQKEFSLPKGALVLASQSSTRRKMLADAGIHFIARAAHVDEGGLRALQRLLDDLVQNKMHFQLNVLRFVLLCFPRLQIPMRHLLCQPSLGCQTP